MKNLDFAREFPLLSGAQRLCATQYTIKFLYCGQEPDNATFRKNTNCAACAVGLASMLRPGEEQSQSCAAHCWDGLLRHRLLS